MTRSRAFAFGLTLAVAVMGIPFQSTPAAAVSSNIVISQIYGGGGATTGSPTYRNDYVELFNRGTVAVDITGWSIQYASAAGSSWSGKTNLAGGVIAPGRYFLVQEGGGTTLGAVLPPTDAVGSISMSATSGKVALVNNQTALTGTGCPIGASVIDLVGYGSSANCFEDGGPTATIANTSAAIRNDRGCSDTDSNAADFSVAAPNPRNSATPTVTCGGITISVSVVGTGSVASAPAGVNCPGVCSASYSSGTTITLTATATSPSEFSGWAGACSGTGSCVLTASAGVTAVFGPATLTPIHAIQGAAHISQLLNQMVKTTGIVTAKRANGYYIQDPAPDADDATSEGIFIFGTPSAVTVNDAVQVVGKVTEFAFGASQLSTTEIQQSLVTKTGTGSITPTIIGIGGRMPPTAVIENDASGSENTTNASFDPAEDGMDFYESLEGMLVQINDAATTSRTEPRFGELWVIADNGANASPRTARGGIEITPTDSNPERILVDDEIFKTGTDASCAALATGSDMPCVNVGATFTGPLVGVVDYDFSTYRVQLIAKPTVASNPLTAESTQPQGIDELAVATFNVENLAPSDPQSKYDRLASILVDHLKSPDIVALEEIQDNSGATDNGVVAADQTFNKLIAAIGTAGGPSYQWRSIDPVNDQDGGQPGGNIRIGYIFRTDRGVAFVDRPGATSTTANAVVGTGTSTHLQYSPGRIDPNEPNGAWDGSRKPLAAEWTFNGHRFFTIANHFNSKGGDESLYGVDQPPQRSSELQRHKQAPIVNDFVAQLETADPNADVIVLGDLNDFQFSDTVTLLKGSQLHTLIDTLPSSERYTYVFEGNSQAIDHTLLSNHLFTSVPWTYDIVHVNSEFADQASDHEPQVTRLYLPDTQAPVVTAPAGVTVEATSPAGATVTYSSCTAVDDVTPAGQLVWDYSPVNGSTFSLGATSVECGATDLAGNRGSSTFQVTVVDTTPPSISAPAPQTIEAIGPNGAPATVTCVASDLVTTSPTIVYAGTLPVYPFGTTTVTCTATDAAGNSSSANTSITVVDTTPPVVVFTGNAGTYTVDQTVNITCTASDGGSGLATNTCANITGPASSFPLGVNTFTATATDKAGNTTTVRTAFTVVATYDSLCALTRRLTADSGIATSLCQKLTNASAAAARGDTKAAANIVAAYRNEIAAQSGKAFTPAAADLLRGIAATF